MTALTEEALAALDAVMAKATPGEWCTVPHCLAGGDKPVDTVKIYPIQQRALGSLDRDVGAAIKAAAYAQGREDAAKVCEAEQLLDPQDASDEGYMRAIGHCAAAIRAAP
jgi:hypothetical protein